MALSLRSVHARENVTIIGPKARVPVSIGTRCQERIDMLLYSIKMLGTVSPPRQKY
jgi:hypothetical protein